MDATEYPNFCAPSICDETGKRTKKANRFYIGSEHPMHKSAHTKRTARPNEHCENETVDEWLTEHDEETTPNVRLHCNETNR